MNAQVIDFLAYRNQRQSLDLFNPLATVIAYAVLSLVVIEIWQRELRS